VVVRLLGVRSRVRFDSGDVFMPEVYQVIRIGSKYIHMAAGVRQQGTGEQPMRESIVRLALGVMLLALSVPAAAQQSGLTIPLAVLYQADQVIK
jgi:hypothetical protein